MFSTIKIISSHAADISALCLELLKLLVLIQQKLVLNV